ncbi:MAG: nucleotidyltransferase family protein, partial [Clostridia bacterium]|nr:nucleotidyltransferase family protein [Clostridia bacterium]
ELTEDVCKELFILSQKHDMSHIVASAVKKLGAFCENEVSAAFDTTLMMSAYRDGQRDYAINLTSSVLEDAGIPYILLKGSELRYYYPETWMRTSCDIDVLIHNEDTEAAEQVLCAAGFRRMQDSSTHDYNYMSPNEFHVEIHFTLSQEDKLPLVNALLESVWEKYTVLAEGKMNQYRMTPELFMIYHLAHMGRHLISGGCGVRPFVDLWLLNRRMSFDEGKLNILLKETNLAELYAVSTKLSEVWMEDKEHSDITEMLEEYILCGGVYGTLANAAKMKSATGTSATKSLYNMIFLPRQNLEILYPNLKKYPFLFFFYQVKRWFNVFHKKKRDRAKNITKAYQTLSGDEVDAAKILLNGLGLDE